MIKKLLYRKSIIAAAALAAVLFSGCELLGLEEDEEKPEEPPATTDVSSGSGGIAAVNRVTATVSGIVRDGVGNPVEGVELSYSNGARSLFRCVTDKDGRYELYFHNESTDVGSSSLGKYQVTLSKDGYTDYVMDVEVPTIKEIRNAYGSTLEGVETSVIVNDTATVILNFDGYHAAINMDYVYLFKLDATVTGYFKIRQNSSIPEADAVVPDAGSLVTVYIGEAYQPHSFTAVTDAAGKFTFSTATGNPLPVFTMPMTVYFSIQPTGAVYEKWSDTYGYAYYSVNVPNLITYPAKDANETVHSTNVGTLYAVGEIRARVLSSSPSTKNELDNDNRMPRLTNTTATPLVFTFDQAMDPASVDGEDIDIQGAIDGGTDYDLTNPALAWSSGNTVLTVTPAQPFKKGDTVTVTFGADFRSENGNELLAPDAVLRTFYVKKGIGFAGASWIDAYNQKSTIDADDTITVTFTENIAAVDTAAYGTGLYTLDAFGDPVSKVDASVSFATNVLTINPVRDLSSGETYGVFFKVKSPIRGDEWLTESDVEVPSTVRTVTVTAVPNIKLIGANIADKTLADNSVMNFAAASDITLTFDSPIAATLKDGETPYSIVLMKAGTPVEAVVTVAGAVATINPAASLKSDTEYYVSYSVWSGVPDSSNVTDTLVFNTAKGAALAVPAITLDANAMKAYYSGRTTYNNGDSVVFASLTEASPDVTYDFQYKKSTETEWSDAAEVLSTVNGTSRTYRITTAALVSGETIQIRAFAEETGCIDSAASNVLSVADTTRPASYIGTDPYSAAFTGSTIDLALADNTVTTAEAVYACTIALPGSEKIGVVGITPSNLANVSYIVSYNTTRTVATITIFVNKAVLTGTTLTAAEPSGSLEVSIEDAAGNDCDTDASTSAVENLVITL